MGIELSYRRVKSEEFERLHNNAKYASIYFGDDLDTDEEIYACYEGLEKSDRYLDLDKHWRSLYFNDKSFTEHDIKRYSAIQVKLASLPS